jgi:uncharacterized protein YjbI with pentapeptide repeats
LRGATLRGADLRGATLSGATLSGATLSDAILSDADLSGADLSGAIGLVDIDNWLAANAPNNLVYKARNLHYPSPESWVWEAGQIIFEICNPLPTDDCGCGVNFATAQWVLQNSDSSSDLWECELVGRQIVVPFNTDGKARTNKLKLVRKITRDELKVIAAQKGNDQ